MSPERPSRRRLLGIAGSALALGVAGCVGTDGTTTDGPAADGTTGRTTGGPVTGGSTDPGSGEGFGQSVRTVDPVPSVDCSSLAIDPPAAADRTTTTGTPAPPDVHLSVADRDDRAHDLTVAVYRDGDEDRSDPLVRRTFELDAQPGPTRLVEGVGEAVAAAGPGTYEVVARLGSGAEDDYAWRVAPGTDGSLSVVVGEDGAIRFAESFDCGSTAGCRSTLVERESVGLPYAVEGAEETFRAGTMTVDHVAAPPTTVAVELAHGGTRILRDVYRLDPGQSVSVPAVTATAGEFAVRVATADGRCGSHTWSVPARDNYPSLVVRVVEDGVLIGCGGRREESVTVRNRGPDRETVALALRRDGRNVATADVAVPAGEETSVRFRLPVGGRYELVADDGSATARAALTLCYCFQPVSVAVTLGDGVGIESRQMVCM